MILIGSRANPNLNQLVSERLGVPLADCTLDQFSNGETKVIIGVSVRGQHVYVISTGCHPVNDHLMETLMICKACKMSNAQSITLIMAHYPYARQDKKTKSRECITASFVAEMLEIAGVNRLVTFDLHSAQIQGMVRLPVDNLFAHKLFANHIRNLYPTLNTETHIVVAPDAGATKRCRDLAINLGLKMALIEKSRNYSNNDQIERMILIDHDHSVMGKTVILYDDIADTLGTLCQACDLLHERGALGVVAVVTHGVLSGPALKRLESCNILTKIICSNTLPVPQSSKIEICDISEKISACIDSLEKGFSLSSLF
jgi:ribose-phosphate pyrophosphokinase